MEINNLLKNRLSKFGFLEKEGVILFIVSADKEYSKRIVMHMWNENMGLSDEDFITNLDYFCSFYENQIENAYKAFTNSVFRYTDNKRDNNLNDLKSDLMRIKSSIRMDITDVLDSFILERDNFLKKCSYHLEPNQMKEVSKIVSLEEIKMVDILEENEARTKMLNRINDSLTSDEGTLNVLSACYDINVPLLSYDKDTIQNFLLEASLNDLVNMYTKIYNLCVYLEESKLVIFDKV